MKKLLALLLVSLMLVGAVACGMNGDDGKIPGDGDPTNNGNDDDTNNTDSNHNGSTDTNNQGNNSGTTDGNQSREGGSGEGNTPSTPATYANAHELLAVIWAAYGSDEKFPAMGGDYDNVVENAPGAFDLTHAEAAANIDSLISFPSDQIDQIDSAASLIHSMNANIFTCGAFHFKTSDAARGMAATIKNHILTKQFICGTPEKLLIVHAPDNYLIVAYGGAAALDPFLTKTQSIITGCELLVDQALT